jgi:dipeptidyl aminopeptidase/acylaminoacyl peptidase
MQPSVIGRRAILQRGAAAAAFALAAPLARPRVAAAAAAAIAPRRVFFDDPDYQGVKISPDGEHLAYLAPLNGVRNLWVAPVADPRAGKPLTQATDRDIGGDSRWAFTNRHLVFFQDHDGDENWRGSSVAIDDGGTKLLTPERGVYALVKEIDRRFPEEMLFCHNQRDKRFFDLFRVNVVTGKSQLLFENREFEFIVADGEFRLRLAGRFAKDGTCDVVARQADGSWAPFTTIPIGDIDSTEFLEFSADGKILYALDTRDRDKAALVAIDMATREKKVLAADADADITWVTFSGRRPLAAAGEKARERWHPIDPATAHDLALLQKYGPGDNEFVSRSYRNHKVTAYYHRDDASGEYVLLDRDKGVVKPLYIAKKSLAKVALRPLEPVVIKARDGLVLNGYLTRPGEPAGAPPPLVLVIHGGPYWRDYWGFSATHQWLANRGYAALSVNYRGSTGFGKAFVTAADREWGGKMQDDLIDSLDWALAQGYGDPKRTAFFGGSYGGYTALEAATKTPDRFTCIVDLFGVSDLRTLMKTIPPYWGPWWSVWKNRLGDPDTAAGRAFLAERSPLTHIERATKPILIAQGMQDVRVVPAESEQMVRALKAKGVPVTYVTFRDEGHGFVRPENRLAFNAVAEAFLAKHLGGRCQPVGDDFAGSTIKIETGGELIPGLKA